MRFVQAVIFGIFWPTICIAQQLEYVGQYRNIRISETDHCYGTDVIFWKNSRLQLVGLLTGYAGPCEDASCSIVTGKIKGGEISFEAHEPVYGDMHRFEGRLSREMLAGQMNSSETTMKKESSFHRDISRKDWCGKWEGVSRCKGVKEYCRESS